MKTSLAFLLLVSVLFITPQLAHASDDLIGTLPDKAQKARPDDTRAGSEKLKKGDTHTNGDGVTVTVDEGAATMSPKVGDADSATTVNTKSHFEGSVNGIDGNDTVTFGSGADANVGGTGGQVNTGGGHITVTNTGATGGPSIHVTDGQGTTHDVAPGETKVFGE